MTVRPEHRHLWSGLVSEADDAEIGVLGVPFDSAVSWRGGARHAPQRMRRITPHLAPITEEGLPLTIGVKDYGDVERDLDWGRFFGEVENRARQILAGRQRLALFIGGDHSVGIPLFAALAGVVEGPLGYIQFDSHPDLADEFEGHRWSHANTARRNLDRPNLSPDRVAFVGLRSFLREELEFRTQNPGLGWHTARDVHRRGIETIAFEIAAQMQGVEAVYYSVDIDGLDPAYAPGTGTPEAGGLSTRQCLELTRLLFQHLPIRAMDIVEVSPPLDISDVTSLAALKIAYETFGFVQAKIQESGRT